LHGGTVNWKFNAIKQKYSEEAAKSCKKQGVQKIQRYRLKRCSEFGKYKNSNKLNNFRKFTTKNKRSRSRKT